MKQYVLKYKNKNIFMTKIIKMNLLKDKESLIYKLKNKDLLVYEDVQGSKIFVNWDGKKFDIVPKSLKNEPLNFVDLSIQKYYSAAYIYFYSLPDYVLNLLNPNWWFCFEYFPDNQPAHIQYNRLPKNNLILSCIVKGSKYTYNMEELVEYSNLFNVESLPILFKGKLSPKQIEVLVLFLNTSESDLTYVFGEANFAHFFYKILNPLEKNSFLMKDGEYNKNLEKIIFKIDNDHRYTFEILNPFYKKMTQENKTEYVEMYSLILLNFLEFCQINGIDKYKLSNITKDKLYVDLMCNLFNDYIINMKNDLDRWDIDIPTFFTEDKFKINIDLLNNKKTVNNVKSNPKIEYIFKIILNSFNKTKKKPFGLFTEQSLTLFNNMVIKISTYLDNLLKINTEYNSQKIDLLNFNDFFNIKYNVDSTGRIYLDDDKLKPEEEIATTNKKKKKVGEVLPKKSMK
jgi:hypothetical protein